MNAYEQLLTQIDAFIRKFYNNRMIKGALLFATFSLLLFLAVISLEYFGRFSSNVRFTLLWTFILGSIFLLTYYVLIPASKLLSFGKRISREQAAVIIGNFFPDVSDKLSNTLQLGEQATENHPNFDLIRASINQRSNQLSVFNFPAVIDLRKNLKYAKYFLVPLVLLLLLLIFNPSFITLPTERVISYNKQFATPKKFTFNLLNNSLKLNQGKTFDVFVEITGKTLPDKVFIHSPFGSYEMSAVSKTKYKFTFDKIAKTFDFYFTANDENSNSYTVEVIPNSVMGKFDAEITYPNYIGKSADLIKNAGDITIPEGSYINWDVLAKNTSKTRFIFHDSMYSFERDGFHLKKRFKKSTSLLVTLKNPISASVDSLHYFITVIKDAFPSINVEQQKDSLSSAIRFFSGQISDDYGLTALSFHYKIISKDGNTRSKSTSVLKPTGTNMSFNFGYDFRSDSLQVGDKIEYYFEVTDNDGVNGHKSTKSSIFTYQLPTTEELMNKRIESLDNAKSSISDLQKEVDKFNKDLNEFKKQSLNSKQNTWEQKNRLNNLEQKQESLQNQIKDLQNKLNESLDEKNSLQKMDPELLKKYDQLQDLLKNVMNDDIKKLLKELQDLLDKNQKNKFDQKLDDFKNKSDEMNRQLDRSMELLKKTQVNEMMKDIAKNLNDLAKEQDKLKDELGDKKLSKEDALNKQESLNNRFDSLQKDFNKMKDLNDGLLRSYPLDEMKNQSEDIKSDMKDASSKISQNKSGSAQGSQKDAAQKMKSMADALQNLQGSANLQQQAEDMKLIREILKNLIAASIKQEHIMNQVPALRYNDPYFYQLGRKQRTLQSESKPIIDSLMELALRQPQTSSFIDKEVGNLTSAQKNIIEAYGNRDKRTVGIQSQFAMTAYNNLALLLNESMQQMQMQMQGQGGEGSSGSPSAGSKGKSGKGKSGSNGDPSSGDDFQKMLQRQLDALKKGMQPGGQQSGQNGEGSGQTPGNSGLPSSQLAKMIAEQRALRDYLEQLRQDLNKDGKGSGNSLNPLLKDLDDQEKDLLQKKYGQEQIMRQQDILTRMLESDKAIKQRGFENKRESESAKSYNRSNINRINEYNREKLKQVELFRSIDPDFSKYYMDRATEFFNQRH